MFNFLITASQISSKKTEKSLNKNPQCNYNIFLFPQFVAVFLFISLRCPDPIPPRNFWKINYTKSKLGHPSPANKFTHWWKVLDPRLNRYIFFIIKASCHIFKGRFFGNLKYLSLRSKFGLGPTTSVILWGPPAGVKHIVTWRVQWAGQKASVEIVCSVKWPLEAKSKLVLNISRYIKPLTISLD